MLSVTVAEIACIPATAMKLLRFEKRVLSLLCQDHRRFEFLHRPEQFTELGGDI